MAIFCFNNKVNTMTLGFALELRLFIQKPTLVYKRLIVSHQRFMV